MGRRSTDLIKTGGYKVGAGEVETALLGHPGRRRGRGHRARPIADLGERIVAFVVASNGDCARRRRADRPRGGQLAPHKRPREVRFVDSLPRNAMGKIDEEEAGGLSDVSRGRFHVAPLLALARAGRDRRLINQVAVSAEACSQRA